MTRKPEMAEGKGGQHIPVMLAEVLSTLAPKDGEVYVDGTFGAGGYTRAVLKAADCTVYAIDRDPDAIKRAQGLKAEFGERFHMIEGCFGDMGRLLPEAGMPKVDGVMLDIGVSSFQLDEAERGFSFMEDGPLDMRMAMKGESAADVVNNYEETRLADIIYRYGEEHKSRRIAAAIVRARLEAPIERTRALASIIEKTLGMPPRRKGVKAVHPATRTFQALRIHVNDELGELARGLEGAEAILNPGGRLVVVCFHSLEDRLVKHFVTERGGRTPAGSRHLPPSLDQGPKPTFELRLKGAQKPGKAEEDVNPRSRSARLRQAIRTDAPAIGGDHA
ncbi:MAG: 16S rRNA (cytosine(1402)-N(4))-methyltransferase RsmH [Alphaproteobacteria bacterium]|nr:MAG: 16S rRNA (cytosine(1402)-N(4))-methyltransferase RsmH [Alphaproteobacteria bacterium]